MLKTILVPTDGSIYSESALYYAIELGRLYSARVRLINIIDVRLLESMSFSGLDRMADGLPVSRLQDELRDTLVEKSEQVLEAAQEMCETMGAQYESESVTGLVPETICRLSEEVDLVSMGQRGEFARWDKVTIGSSVESVVRHAAKPILLSPLVYKDIRRALLAYDGSGHANRALEVAADFCRHAGWPLLVLAVKDDLSEGGRIIKEAERLLLPYNLLTRMVVKKGDAAETILSTCRDENCDLVIMGAYGHTRIREAILGSTTEEVMRNTKIPLLLVR